MYYEGQTLDFQSTALPTELPVVACKPVDSKLLPRHLPPTSFEIGSLSGSR
jgi:hypothetical protein